MSNSPGLIKNSADTTEPMNGECILSYEYKTNKHSLSNQMVLCKINALD